MVQVDDLRIAQVFIPIQVGTWCVRCPGPGIAEPDGGEQVEFGEIRSAVVSGNPDQDVFVCGFGIFDKHVEVPVVVKCSGVHQLIFPFVFAALPVFFDQLRIGKGLLGIFIQKLHVGMRGRGVKVKVIFFDVFPMITFVAGQSKQALFQNRIFPVPESQREANVLVTVADAADAIFSPPIGS